MAGLSDVPMAKNAERFMYDWLLRNGVEVFEYRKNILHGKLAVCDGEWMTIGSYNVNNISAYASIELNVDVKDPGIIQSVEEMLDYITRKDCTRITHEQLVHTRNILRQFIRWTSYRIFSLILYLFTFYFKQRKYF
jgi:cardiolipin synthase